MMDIVYRVRVGENNEPLRYSLRSLTHVPHRRVIITGFKPTFVRGVTYLYRNQTDQSDQANSNGNLLLALTLPDLTDDFIVMDDDMFFMRPITHLPLLHQGPLDTRIAAYKTSNRFHQAYSLIKTRNELLRLGAGPREVLLSYELHTPMIYNRERLISLFREQTLPLFALRPRTLYGNRYRLQGEFARDAKDTGDTKGQFYSTGEWDHYGAPVRSRFRLPGPYE